MDPFIFPTLPAVYLISDDGPQLCQSCPAFVDSCAGTESGKHAEADTPALQLDSEQLNEFRLHFINRTVSYFNSMAVPLAIRLRVLSPTRTIADLEATPTIAAEVPTSTDPKGLARMYLRSLAKNLATLRRLQTAQTPILSDCLSLMFLIESQQSCVAGILAGIDSTGRRTTSAGAEGRRKIGEGTRERVRLAAAHLRGRVSKEEAAAQIAKTVGKGAATVRRHLSSLFPGDSWRSTRSDESTDMTHKIG